MLDKTMSLTQFKVAICEGDEGAWQIVSNIMNKYKFCVVETMWEKGWRGARIVEEFNKRGSLDGLVLYIMRDSKW